MGAPFLSSVWVASGGMVVLWRSVSVVVVVLSDVVVVGERATVHA